MWHLPAPNRHLPAPNARIGSIPARQPLYASDMDPMGGEPAGELTGGDEGRHVGLPGMSSVPE